MKSVHVEVVKNLKNVALMKSKSSETPNKSIQRTFHSVVCVCYSLSLIVAHKNHAAKCR